MTNRPRGSGSGAPEEGSAEYEWLYGTGSGAGPGGPGSGSTGGAADDDRTRAIPTTASRDARGSGGRGTSDRPEETRVLPAMQDRRGDTAGTAGTSGARSRTSRGDGGAPPPPPAAPPSHDRGGGRGPRRPRRRRPVRRILLLLVLAFLVFMISVPLWTWSQIDKVDAAPSGNRPAEGAGTNYLIVGSDKADDLSEDQRTTLRTGPRGGTNTDTIIVLHTGSGPNTMMSIPRDTLAEIPGQGTGMINSAFSIGKAPLLVATVEGLTDLRIDHYVELGFGSVINTVDALGGVEICPEIDMRDEMARLDIEKGCQEVDGMTALAYSRSRHVTALSDLDRVARQREVIGSLGDKVVSPATFLNPLRYWRFNDAAGDSIRIDEEMNPIDLGRFALAMTGDRKTCTMPNQPAPSDPNRVVMDEARAEPLLTALREGSDIPAASCTATGRPKS